MHDLTLPITLTERELEGKNFVDVLKFTPSQSINRILIFTSSLRYRMMMYKLIYRIESIEKGESHEPKEGRQGSGQGGD